MHRNLRAEWEKLNQERVAVERRLREMTAPRARPKVPPKKRPAPQQAPEDAPKRPRSEQAAYDNDAVKARSRRMFGNLMGHLGSAKTRLERDPTLDKQRSAQAQIAAKLDKERTAQRQRARAERRMERGREVAERDRVLTALRVTEEKMLFATWEDARERLKGVLRTKAEPALCWRPRHHTSRTKHLLAQNKDAVAADIAANHAMLDDRIATLQRDLDERQARRDEAAARSKAELEGAAADHRDDDDMDDDDHRPREEEGEIPRPRDTPDDDDDDDDEEPLPSFELPPMDDDDD